jgi:hypothetical protein
MSLSNLTYSGYPPPLGGPPWSVFYTVCVNIDGYILNWEIRVHHWPQGLIFMKNAMSDSVHRAVTMTDADDGSAKRRQRSGSGYFWLPVCSINNIYNWRAAVNIWYLWTSNRTRGFAQRSRYGLILFSHYRGHCREWNNDHDIDMTVLPYNFTDIRRKFGELAKRGLHHITELVDSILDDVDHMPVVNVDNIT